MTKKKNFLTVFFLIILIPLVIFGGSVLFQEKYYLWISFGVAILSCIPLLYCFEKKDSSSKELTVLAVMIALSASGRFLFAWIPGFKPVTALTIIAAVYLGKEAGFVVGALSAIVSNFYFGQGPWTPFQMFAWGILGFVAGCLSKPLRKNKIILCVFGAAAGIVYSLAMDVWSTLWADGTLNLSRYMASVAAAFPVTVIYAVSNVIFLLLLAKPIGEKLGRIKKKYGLFAKEQS